MVARNIGERILRAREAKGLSREELAAKIGCSLFSLRRWERGESVPIRIFKRKLEEELEIDLSEEAREDRPLRGRNPAEMSEP